MVGFIETILAFLVVLTVLVFVHELGHYVMARRNGVRVEIFSIGFGPELFGKTDRAGTRWKFSLIPLGGYVKMYGDANAASQPGRKDETMGEEERAISFQHKRLSQRSWIVAAGPLANFLFAIVALAGLFAFSGQPYTPPVVGQVQPDSAAAEAGLEPGDRFVSIAGQSIERFEEVQRIVRLNPDTRLEITVKRDGTVVTLSAVPESRAVEDGLGNRTIGLLGVTATGLEYRRYDPVTAVYEAGKETFALTGATLEAVGQIISGSRSAEELGGPIRIAQISGEVADTGVTNLIWFMAVLSINLGLINLFPIPMLDGGHLLFYLFEAVRGRPLGERAQEYGFRIGLALVLTLMLFVTWNDLAQLQVFSFFKGLVT